MKRYSPLQIAIAVARAFPPTTHPLPLFRFCPQGSDQQWASHLNWAWDQAERDCTIAKAMPAPATVRRLDLMRTFSD